MTMSPSEVDAQILKNGGYSAIRVKNPSGSEKELFICKFEDGDYHLLGQRPSGPAAMYFSEREETRQNLGKVILPEGKKKLTDLVKGEKFTINPERTDSYQVEYIEHSN